MSTEPLPPHPGAPAPAARIRAVTPLSLCDWPGKNVSVIFTGGCNLRCPTCHNASLAFTPSRHPVMDLEAVLGSLKARKAWLDGVVVCGGEPTLDPGLPGLVRALDGLGFKVKVDTNGMLPGVIARVLESCPGTVFAVDVKGPWERYPSLTGGAVTPAQARAALEQVFTMAVRSPESFLFRITLVPGLAPEDARAARLQLPEGFALTQQRYVPPPGGKETTHAPADREARRMSGDLVARTDIAGNP